MGTYWPGWIATGWYGVPGLRGSRQFLAVYRSREQLLVVDTALRKPARIVIATPRAEVLAAAIDRAPDRATGEALGPTSSS